MSKGLLPPSPTSVAIGNPGKKQQKPQTEGQVIAYDDRKKRTNELNQHTAQEMRLLSTIIVDVDGIVLSPRSKAEEAHTAKPSISVSTSTVSERADNGMARSLADEIADDGEDKAYEFISSRSGVEVPIDSTSFPLAPPPPPKSEETPTSTEQLSISGSASPGRSKKSPSSFVRAKRSFFSRLSKPQPSQVGQMSEEYIAEPPPVETEKPAVPENTETFVGPPPYLNPMLVAFAANDRLDEAAEEAEEGVAGTKKNLSSKAKKTQKTKLRKGASKLGKNKSKGLSASRHSSQNTSEEDDASCSRADRVCRLFESDTLWTIFTTCTTCS